MASIDDDDEDYEDDDFDTVETEEDEDEQSNTKKYIIAGIIGLVIVIVILFITLTKEKPAPPPAPTPTETVSAEEKYLNDLNELGIGSEVAVGSNVYTQGNIEDNTFRKDLLGIDSTENYSTPIKVATVTDGVTYVKHRAMTGEGIDLYYLDIEYKGSTGLATISYSLYQLLPAQGTLDMYVEIVTDSNNKTFATSFTQLPIASYKKK